MTFDALAGSYDHDFTQTQCALYLRGRVQARLLRHWRAGMHVLELGCGTGEDALFLTTHGIQVTATDASSRMLETARAKIDANALVRLEKLDLQRLPEGRGEIYDGVFANFGPLNVLDDWRPLAAWLAARIAPGGAAAFAVMSPLCLWEMAWHGLHADFATAFRRLSKKTTFQASKEQILPIHYPTIRRLTRDFAPFFRRRHVSALGLFLPPSDVYGALEKRPRLFKALLALEKRLAPLLPLALFADHYWIEFERL